MLRTALCQVVLEHFEIVMSLLHAKTLCSECIWCKYTEKKKLNVLGLNLFYLFACQHHIVPPYLSAEANIPCKLLTKSMSRLRTKTRFHYTKM